MDCGKFLGMIVSFLLYHSAKKGLSLPSFLLQANALKHFNGKVNINQTLFLPQPTASSQHMPSKITGIKNEGINDLITIHPDLFSNVIGSIKGKVFCSVSNRSNSADLYIILEDSGKRVEKAYQFKASNDIGFSALFNELKRLNILCKRLFMCCYDGT